MAISSFNQKCLEMLHAQSVKEFSARLFSFAESLGFGTVAAAVITDHSRTLTEFQTITNVPPSYLAEFENLDLGQIDPVSQHCKFSSSPIVWDRHTYASRREQELWQHQASFGLSSGVAFAMHPGKGRHFMLGAEWNYERCADVPHFRRIGEDLLEFGAHAQAAAFELCLPTPRRSQSDQPLEKRELEALGWSMDGKSSWEIGNSMSISETHATLVLRRAMYKLGCSTKYEAVLRAIRLGLLNTQ